MVYDEIAVALDIGTTKVVCLIAEKDDSGNTSILARGEARSEGLRKGSVVNIEATAKAIRSAVEQAEKLAGVEVKNVSIGISGDHIKSQTSSGMVTISGSNKIVTKEDVFRVIESAKAINIPSDREILHIIPLDFAIDGIDGIQEPVGMAGMRLNVKIHVITAAKASMQNLRNSVAKVGLTVSDFVLQPLASSHAILTDDECEMGVCLVDIGGGTTDIAMYYQSALYYTSVVSVGGTNVTNDLSVGLRTPLEFAENIKTSYGVAHAGLVHDDRDGIEVPGVGGRDSAMVSKKIVSQIIQPRMEELFELVYKDLKHSGHIDHMAAGVVLTGGASMLPGVAELAEKTLGLPVKIEIPHGVTGLIDAVNEPKYATAVGLLKYKAHVNSEKENGYNRGVKMSGLPKWDTVVSRFKTWLDDML